MTVPYRQVLRTHKQTDRSTQPGHPSVGRHSKYQPLSPHFSICHLSQRITGQKWTVKCGNQKVKGQGHSGVTYAQNALLSIIVVTYWWNHNSRRSYSLFQNEIWRSDLYVDLDTSFGWGGSEKEQLRVVDARRPSGRHCITAGWRPMPVTVISWSMNM